MGRAAASLLLLMVALPLLGNQRRVPRETGKAQRRTVEQARCPNPECRGLVRPSQRPGVAYECLNCGDTFDSLPAADSPERQPYELGSPEHDSREQGGGD